jgi:hypothetical protein
MIPNPKPAWWPNFLEVADATVDVSELDPKLIAFLQWAAGSHVTRFRRVLIITSGNDGTHAPGSKHYTWKAVDLRSHDLPDPEQDAFAESFPVAERTFKVGVFDERFIGAAHWHVETA